MNRSLNLFFLPLAVCGCAWASHSKAPDDLLNRLPLRFEMNRGQADSKVRFLSRMPGYALFLTPDQAVIAGRAGTVRMSLPGANLQASMQGVNPQRTRTTYFTGAKRIAGVESFSSVRASEVWPGIDAVYYGSGRQLEFDFVVKPGADPNRIRMKFSGAQRLRIDGGGALVLSTNSGEIRQEKPVVYQTDADGSRRLLDGRYEIRKDGEIRFALGAFDRSRTLVVDPILKYSTFLGGSRAESATAMALDPQGNIWITGQTTSLDLPLNGTPYDADSTATQDVFVAKINPRNQNDESLTYATYIGGGAADIARDIAFGPDGFVYITGETASSDFPRVNATQNEAGGGLDVFVAKIDPNIEGVDGLVYCTYFGGDLNESGTAIAADENSAIYVAGSASGTELPVTGSALQPAAQGGVDAFFMKIDPGGLAYVSYLGGSSTDAATSIGYDSRGFIVVSGYTFSNNFPITGNSYRAEYAGGGDGFIAVIDPSKSNFDSFVYATYYGGSGYDAAYRMTFDASGSVWLTGTTLSNDLPVLGQAVQTALAGSADAFLARFDLSLPAAQQLTYSSYFGGSGADVAYGLALDGAGRVYLAGYTLSANLKVKGGPLQATLTGGTSDAFLAVIDPRAPGDGGLLYSTYIGGANTDVANRVAVDAAGDIYVAGFTQSSTFKVTDAPRQNALNGISDAFVTKFKTCRDSLAPEKACEE